MHSCSQDGPWFKIKHKCFLATRKISANSKVMVTVTYVGNAAFHAAIFIFVDGFRKVPICFKVQKSRSLLQLKISFVYHQDSKLLDIKELL